MIVNPCAILTNHGREDYAKTHKREYQSTSYFHLYSPRTKLNHQRDKRKRSTRKRPNLTVKYADMHSPTFGG